LFHSKAQDLEQNQTVLQNAGAVDILWKVIGQSSEVLENLGIIRYLCINSM
jgi:DNA-directed RNA polymerase subunit N (RpoN/RPB10)